MLEWVILVLVLLAGLTFVAWLITRDSLSDFDVVDGGYRDKQSEPVAPNLDRDFRTGRPIPGLPLVDLMRIDRQLKLEKKKGKSQV